MDQNKELREELTQAKKEGHFVFVPSTPLPKINGLFVPVLDKVKLLKTDFYPNQGKFGMHHNGAMKLGEAAGIQWAAESGRVGRMDNRDNPNYCSFRVVGRIRTNEGLWAEVAGHKHIDLDAKRGALETKYGQQFDFKTKDFQKGQDRWGNKVTKPPWPKNKDDYIRHYSDRDLNQIRETMDERCESGAQSRVVRNILHLPVSFPEHEERGKGTGTHDGITKTFYIVRFALDAANPKVQAVQLASFQQSILGVYGVSTIEGPPVPAALPEKDVTPQNEEPESGTDPDTRIVDFENTSPEEQERAILDLIQRYGYQFYDADMKGNPELRDWGQDSRTNYFKHILKSIRG